MSHKHPGGPSPDASDEHKLPPRVRQPTVTSPGEPPARRSWRPCQMLGQDGEPNPHHHHHHPHPHQHRGPPRQRRRPPPGQGRGPGRSPAQTPAVTPAETPAATPVAPEENRDTEPPPVHQPRPAVSRYRRPGDPRPRPRQPPREAQAPSPRQEQSPPEDQQQDPQQQDPQQQDPQQLDLQQQQQQQQTPITDVAPTHLSPDTPPDAPPPDASPPPAQTSAAPQTSCAGGQTDSVPDSDGDAGQTEPDEERPPEAARDHRAAEGPEEGGAEGEGQEGGAPEVSDLCSDTESAASLSLDGPLHSPPPLHSPSPPSSPDAMAFPQHDHFSEDAGSSPPPDDSQPLPEEEEEEEEEQQMEEEEDWSSLDTETHSDVYPKTYADFYSQSHPKAAPLDPPAPPQSNLQPKPPPSSFPEPLRTSYPSETPQEPPASHPRQSVQRGAPPPFTKGPHPLQRPGGHSPPDRSVGCRLHHYDGSSDGERDGGATGGPRQRGVEAPDPSEDSGSEDTISMAIKDIKEAIEEVKTRTVRSPYTPDSSVQPVWVMRQEASPGEGARSPQHQHSAQHSARCSSPRSPSQSPSSYASVPACQAVSPSRRAESSRPLHPRQQPPYSQPQQEREAPGPPQLYGQQPGQHQQRSRVQHRQPPLQQQQPSVQDIRRAVPHFPTFVDVPGPCDPEDLIDGIIFAATYLGCTHLLSERTPTKSARMQQAQEAMNRVRAAQKQAKNRKKSPEGDDPSTAEVDLFMSTQRIKVLNADTQESLMDLPLRTISYIADIGNMVVLMARGKMVRSRSAQEHLEHSAEQSSMAHDDRRLYRMICHVFESEDAQLIAQSIGQSFSVAYQEFLRANGIDPDDLSQREYSDLLNTQDMYNDDLIHFSKSENCRDVYIEKQKGEMLGVVIVESGWGSILPTVIIASMMHTGPAEKSGRLNIGDQIMTVNGTSLVGLPLSTCQSIIKGLKSQSRIKMNIVRCPPVTMVLIRRPDLRYQLGFSVQNGIICSLMRGGIAERGGVRVGHRIIEINGQSVVATPHEKIVQILSNAMGEIHMKTMPAAMYRLLTAQEQPVYI